MNIELVAQMFKNYQNNVFFNLEGSLPIRLGLTSCVATSLTQLLATGELKEPS